MALPELLLAHSGRGIVVSIKGGEANLGPTILSSLIILVLLLLLLLLRLFWGPREGSQFFGKSYIKAEHVRKGLSADWCSLPDAFPARTHHERPVQLVSLHLLCVWDTLDNPPIPNRHYP